MKRLILILAAVTLSHSSAGAAGGDLGGGGFLRDIQRTVRLSPEEVNWLKSHGNEQEAFVAWVQSLEPRKREAILEKIFEYQVLPQLDQ